jgi:cytochrome c oxidase assembly protein subunit 15
VSAWRHHRREPRITWTTTAALLLTGFQGWLGGRVVAHELAAWIVTAHLVVAIVIVQMLLYVAVTAADVTDRRRRAPMSVTAGAGALILLTLVQAAVGTQVRGAIDEALDAGVDRGAAVATLGAIDVVHRDLAFLVLLGAALLTMWLLSRRSPPPIRRWSLVTLALAILQVGLGVYMAYGFLLPAAQVAHLTVASLLLGAETVLLLEGRRQTV